MLQTAEDLEKTVTIKFLITIVPLYPNRKGKIMKEELKGSNVPIF